MTAPISKAKRMLFLIAAMLSNIAVMADMVLYPITNSLYEAFPESLSLVNYILSGPPLLIVVFSLVTPILLKKMSKRSVMILGSVLFTIGGVFGVSVESPLYMAAMRTLVGMGQGMINVCAVALICEVYVDEQERSKYIGYFNASMNVVGMVFTYVAGLIAANSSWQNNFLLYLSAIPMLIMVVLFVPKLESGAVEEIPSSTGKKQGMGMDFWQMILVFFIICTLCMVPAYFMSVYVAENALGSETVYGTASALGQVASFVAAMCFGAIYNKLKRFTCTVGIGLSVVCFALWYFTTGVATVYAVTLIQSIAYLFLFSYCYARAPEIVPPEKVDTAIGIVTATYGIGGFLSTYFATFLMNVTHAERFTDTIIILPIFAAIVLVLDIIYMLWRRK